MLQRSQARRAPAIPGIDAPVIPGNAAPVTPSGYAIETPRDSYLAALLVLLCAAKTAVSDAGASSQEVDDVDPPTPGRDALATLSDAFPAAPGNDAPATLSCDDPAPPGDGSLAIPGDDAPAIIGDKTPVFTGNAALPTLIWAIFLSIRRISGGTTQGWV